MRGKILDEVRQVINGDRQDAYGNPEDSFSLIADLWDSYLHERFDFLGNLEKIDVALMMALLKIAREAHQHKHDNLVDAIGYLALAADMEGEG